MIASEGTPHWVLVDELPKIAMMYFKGMFIIDLIGVLPWQVMNRNLPLASVIDLIPSQTLASPVRSVRQATVRGLLLLLLIPTPKLFAHSETVSSLPASKQFVKCIGRPPSEIRVLDSVRLLKLFRLYRIRRFMTTVVEKFPKSVWLMTAFELVFSMVICAHWMSCLWLDLSIIFHRPMSCFVFLYHQPAELCMVCFASCYPRACPGWR